nr:MAG TPA: hypothetical protein [Caudoviricetes sp.]
MVSRPGRPGSSGGRRRPPPSRPGQGDAPSARAGRPASPRATPSGAGSAPPQANTPCPRW